MTEEKIQMTEARRRRVKRLKRGILMLVLLALLVPTVLCLKLLIQVTKQEETLSVMRGQIAEISAQLYQLQEIQKQQEKSQEDQPSKTETETVVVGSGTANIGETENKAGEPEAKHKVYLTFDDGPSCYTADILDILDHYDVKATFFVVGKESEAAKEAMQEIVNRGHTLGMHSYSHKYAEVYRSMEDFSADLEKIRNLILETTGVESVLYRFPGGSSNTVSSVPMQDFADYLEQQDIRYFDWNIASGDGVSSMLPVEKLVSNCTTSIEQYSTAVILLHDLAEKRSTVEALPIILENILALEDTEILPITEDTEPVQHITKKNSKE